jgi:hypothetical protein
MFPVHCLESGTQDSAHPPLVHTPGHSSPSCQLPAGSHSCVTAPLHCSIPGLHSPVHSPAAQTNAQGAPSCHSPVGPHVWGTKPSHCVIPSSHSPTQLPETHEYGQSVTSAVTRSGPHSTNWSPSHTLPPGSWPMHNATGSWQDPCVNPGVVSQSCFPEQDCSAFHVMLVGSQMSTSFCACPAHASSSGVQQASPFAPIGSAPPSHADASPSVSTDTSPAEESPAKPPLPPVAPAPPSGEASPIVYSLSYPRTALHPEAKSARKTTTLSRTLGPNTLTMFPPFQS